MSLHVSSQGFCLIFFFGTRKFILYTRTMAEVDDALNLRVDDYSVRLHGLYGIMDHMPDQTYSPTTLKTYVEGALRTYAERLSEVHDEPSQLSLLVNFRFPCPMPRAHCLP